MEWNLNIPHDSSRTDEQPTHQTVPHFGLVLNHSCSWRDHLQYITSNLCLYYYVGLSGNKSWLSLYYCLWFCLISSNINSINSNTIFFISYFFFLLLHFLLHFLFSSLTWYKKWKNFRGNIFGWKENIPLHNTSSLGKILLQGGKLVICVPFLTAHKLLRWVYRLGWYYQEEKPRNTTCFLSPCYLCAFYDGTQIASFGLPSQLILVVLVLYHDKAQ